MKKYLIGFIFIFLSFSLSVFSAGFEEVSLPQFEKEILSEKQIRFVDKSDSKHVIHLQVEKYDSENLWTDKTLKQDVESMMETRRSMYSVFGFSDVKLDHYDLKKMSTRPQLNLYGSYMKFKKHRVYFSESNIYFGQYFLQVKILSENGKISEDEVQKILNQVNPTGLGIK